MTAPVVSEQVRLAGVLCAQPARFQAEIAGVDERSLRFRSAPGEWSAIEVVGHLVDKMQVWRERVLRVAAEDRPFLPGYDQDAYVRERRYQDRPRTELLAQLAEACEQFAAVVEMLPDDALVRAGIHGENGPMTLRQCIEMPLGGFDEHLAQVRQALMSGETD